MRERAIITIPFLRVRSSEEKGENVYTPREREREKESTAKSDKSGALTAGTFERSNPVMQIRFSAMIFLLLPRYVHFFFPELTVLCQFLHRFNDGLGTSFTIVCEIPIYVYLRKTERVRDYICSRAYIHDFAISRA